MINLQDTLKSTVNNECQERNLIVSARLFCSPSEESDNFGWKSLDEKECVVLHSSIESVLTQTNSFNFDKTFGITIKNSEIYKEVVHNVVKSFIVGGQNAAVILYGQTASGKSYTMYGNEEKHEKGLIQNVAQNIFDFVDNIKDEYYSILRVSFVEIVNDEIRDLLRYNSRNISVEIENNSQSSVTIRKDNKQGIAMNTTEVIVRNSDSILELFHHGYKNRRCIDQSNHKSDDSFSSSKSHVIFRITVERRSKRRNHKGKNQPAQTSTLNFVDISSNCDLRDFIHIDRERVINLKRSIDVDQNLVTLSDALLCYRSRDSNFDFFDSKLTSILQPCLSGNSVVSLICCVSSSRTRVEEGRTVLLFGHCAKEFAQNETRLKSVGCDDKISFIVKEIDSTEECKKFSLKTTQKHGTNLQETTIHEEFAVSEQIPLKTEGKRRKADEVLKHNLPNDISGLSIDNSHSMEFSKDLLTNVKATKEEIKSTKFDSFVLQLKTELNKVRKRRFLYEAEIKELQDVKHEMKLLIDSLKKKVDANLDGKHRLDFLGSEHDGEKVRLLQIQKKELELELSFLRKRRYRDSTKENPNRREFFFNNRTTQNKSIKGYLESNKIWEVDSYIVDALVDIFSSNVTIGKNKWTKLLSNDDMKEKVFNALVYIQYFYSFIMGLKVLTLDNLSTTPFISIPPKTDTTSSQTAKDNSVKSISGYTEQEMIKKKKDLGLAIKKKKDLSPLCDFLFFLSPDKHVDLCDKLKASLSEQESLRSKINHLMERIQKMQIDKEELIFTIERYKKELEASELSNNVLKENTETILSLNEELSIDHEALETTNIYLRGRIDDLLSQIACFANRRKEEGNDKNITIAQRDLNNTSSESEESNHETNKRAEIRIINSTESETGRKNGIGSFEACDEVAIDMTNGNDLHSSTSTNFNHYGREQMLVATKLSELNGEEENAIDTQGNKMKKPEPLGKCDENNTTSDTKSFNELTHQASEDSKIDLSHTQFERKEMASLLALLNSKVSTLIRICNDAQNNEKHTKLINSVTSDILSLLKKNINGSKIRDNELISSDESLCGDKISWDLGAFSNEEDALEEVTIDNLKNQNKLGEASDEINEAREKSVKKVKINPYLKNDQADINSNSCEGSDKRCSYNSDVEGNAFDKKDLPMNRQVSTFDNLQSVSQESNSDDIKYLLIQMQRLVCERDNFEDKINRLTKERDALKNDLQRLTFTSKTNNILPEHTVISNVDNQQDSCGSRSFMDVDIVDCEQSYENSARKQIVVDCEQSYETSVEEQDIVDCEQSYEQDVLDCEKSYQNPTNERNIVNCGQSYQNNEEEKHNVDRDELSTNSLEEKDVVDCEESYGNPRLDKQERNDEKDDFSKTGHQNLSEMSPYQNGKNTEILFNDLRETSFQNFNLSYDQDDDDDKSLTFSVSEEGDEYGPFINNLFVVLKAAEEQNQRIMKEKNDLIAANRRILEENIHLRGLHYNFGDDLEVLKSNFTVDSFSECSYIPEEKNFMKEAMYLISRRKWVCKQLESKECCY